MDDIKLAKCNKDSFKNSDGVDVMILVCKSDIILGKESVVQFFEGDKSGN